MKFSVYTKIVLKSEITIGGKRLMGRKEEEKMSGHTRDIVFQIAAPKRGRSYYECQHL